MLEYTEFGLYCPVGDFFIDPLRAVHRAVITHAHADHARRGMDSYLCHRHTEPLLRSRLGKNIRCQPVEYGEVVNINGISVSLHPAGHVVGSSQIRVEHKGQVWVASGDYKRDTDPYAAPFEVVKCHTFISESTFGLPVYDWPDQRTVITEINEWWRENASNNKPSVISAYSLGKAQHIIGSVDRTIGPIYVHNAVEEMNAAMRSTGIDVPRVGILSIESTHEQLKHALIIAPNVADGPDWMQEDFAFANGRASGWFAVNRAARRQPHERGFTLSDHADWKALVQTIDETECEQLLVNHGFTAELSRFFSERGLQASELESAPAAHVLTKSGSHVRSSDSWKPISKICKYVCEHHGIEPWLFDACNDHVGNLAETVALLLPHDREIPEYFGKRIIAKIEQLRTQVGEVLTTSGQRQARNPTGETLTPSGLRLGAQTINCVLMHVHLRTGGRRGFDKLTLGVWKDNELVPLVHVSPTIDDDLYNIIVAFMKEHTLVRSGPVRTIEPHFVFEISIGGIEPAPRKKSGINITESKLLRYVIDKLPVDAAQLSSIVNSQ